MSKFKVGDLAFVVCDKLAEFYDGLVYVEYLDLDDIFGNENPHMRVLFIELSKEKSTYKSGRPVTFLKRRFKKLEPNINDLNKLLYPDYVEYEGYLISKEAYETLTHQKK